MAYIDTKHLGKCETCRHHRSGECNTFCDCGEEYSPDMFKIPTADVVEVVRCKDCVFYYAEDGDCFHPKQEGGWNSEGGESLKMEKIDFCSYGKRRDTNDR